VVKGYKRETRVRIHAVVDFRAAPTLADLASAVTGAAGTTATTKPTTTTTSETDANALQAALQPSIGGQILHFTIE
jgi:predicted nicotinamide N-methyase